MALTFPRELPDYKVRTLNFRLADSVAASTSRSGSKINRTRTADPVWVLEVSTNVLESERKRLWTAWKNSLRGGLRNFVAADITRNPPAAYPEAGQPQDISSGWDGTAAVASLGDAGVLGLSGLPSGYQAKVGDRVGLEENGSFGYYEVEVDATASSGGAITLTVSPFLHKSIFSTSAVARLWLPKAKFVFDWQSWQESSELEATPVSFQAVQQVL